MEVIDPTSATITPAQDSSYLTKVIHQAIIYAKHYQTEEVKIITFLLSSGKNLVVEWETDLVLTQNDTYLELLSDLGIFYCLSLIDIVALQTSSC